MDGELSLLKPVLLLKRCSNPNALLPHAGLMYSLSFAKLVLQQRVPLALHWFAFFKLSMKQNLLPALGSMRWLTKLICHLDMLVSFLQLSLKGKA